MHFQEQIFAIESVAIPYILRNLSSQFGTKTVQISFTKSFSAQNYALKVIY